MADEVAYLFARYVDLRASPHPLKPPFWGRFRPSLASIATGGSTPRDARNTGTDRPPVAYVHVQYTKYRQSQ